MAHRVATGLQPYGNVFLKWLSMNSAVYDIMMTLERTYWAECWPNLHWESLSLNHVFDKAHELFSEAVSQLCKGQDTPSII